MPDTQHTEPTKEQMRRLTDRREHEPTTDGQPSEDN